ncbi:PREDICTED: serine protease easter-like isoform X2 [Papilio polytes]|uniref:serine protease easter-like isoform X2 n=1 Tax=Papilio polytes TaxID=76194 RepID=UPI0006764957|nr:PREDICTED: serine protease easter-like isoform X2 [Papilio polytes]
MKVVLVCGNINEDYTISDKPHFEEFPWMALIFNSESDKEEKFLSSGTLINSRYVLTLVECTDIDHYNARSVRIGEYNINTESDCEDEGGDTICALPAQDIRVQKVDRSSDCHENASFFTNCVALLRLEKAVDFKKPNAGAICLPMARDLLSRNLSGLRGTLAGWGLSNNPNTLRKSSSTVVSEVKCMEYIRTRNVDKLLNTVCVKSSKHFEIGAPLMIKTDHIGYKRYTQYGILSTGLQDSDINIFVDITKYMKWILDTIKV